MTQTQQNHQTQILKSPEFRLLLCKMRIYSVTRNLKTFSVIKIFRYKKHFTSSSQTQIILHTIYARYIFENVEKLDGKQMGHHLIWRDHSIQGHERHFHKKNCKPFVGRDYVLVAFVSLMPNTVPHTSSHSMNVC